MQFVGVVELLAGAQHRSFATLSEALGESFEGLTVAARMARRQGLLTPALARQCERLDVAAHFTRHITAQKAQSFLCRLHDEIANKKKKILVPPLQAEESGRALGREPEPEGGLGDCYKTADSNGFLSRTEVEKMLADSQHLHNCLEAKAEALQEELENSLSQAAASQHELKQRLEASEALSKDDQDKITTLESKAELQDKVALECARTLEDMVFDFGEVAGPRFRWQGFGLVRQLSATAGPGRS